MEYFATLDKEQLVQELGEKIESYYNFIGARGITDRIRKSYRMYYGYNKDGMFHASSEVHNGGRQGELSLMTVNHYRNLIQHMLTLTTSQKPEIKTQAANTDYKTISQTILADALLEYYMRDKRLERVLKRAAEFALMTGEGFVSTTWNVTSGKQYGVNPDTKAPIYEGDIEYKTFSTLDIIRDVNKETYEDCQWVITRCFKNKFDLVDKHPKIRDKILALEYEDKPQRNDGYEMDSDDVAYYEFYHNATDSVPNGRYTIFLSDDIVLYDGAMPYDKVPVRRITPGDFLGSPFGYTLFFDLMGLQEQIDALYSTVISNQNTFGVQNILCPNGHNITMETLAGGLNVAYYDPKLGKPESMNLLATPPEIFNFILQLEEKMQIISGINSVARGNPEASLKSGSALALVASQAVQFSSFYQQSYVALVEDVATDTINILKDYAEVPRMALIAGKTRRYMMQEFKGEDISDINRVRAEVANPVHKMPAGRIEMANNLMQSGLIKTPDEYIQVMNTGRIEPLTEGLEVELMSIRAENEALKEGDKEVRAIATDDHKSHIMEHKSVISDPEIRMNNMDIVDRALGHIQEHIELLRITDPALLMLTGNQPIEPSPVQGAPLQGNERMQTPDNNPIPAEMPQAPNMPNMPDGTDYEIPANV